MPAEARKHGKVDVHIGDPVQLNVERHSKVGHINGLLAQTRGEVLKRCPLERLRHDVLGNALGVRSS
jgi:hypothetical protein